MRGPCLCGDPYCGSCGPAQGYFQAHPVGLPDPNPPDYDTGGDWGGTWDDDDCDWDWDGDEDYYDYYEPDYYEPEPDEYEGLGRS